MLTLHAHPLSSFCWKALIALYENDTPFEFSLLDLANPGQYAERWPIARMPGLSDKSRDLFVPEATIIVEYLDRHYRGPTRFVPDDADAALDVRLWDRFFDLYVNVPMQKVVADRIRPAGAHDPLGVAEAKRLIATAYGVIEKQLGDNPFAVGEDFSMADCAAAPALAYASRNVPLSDYPRSAAYLERLRQRPSFARVLREAAPYAHLYPAE